MKRMTDCCTYTVFIVLGLLINNVFSQQTDSMKMNPGRAADNSKIDSSLQNKNGSVNKENDTENEASKSNKERNKYDSVIEESEKEIKSKETIEGVGDIDSSLTDATDPKNVDTLLNDNHSEDKNKDTENNDSSRTETTDVSAKNELLRNEKPSDDKGENKESVEEKKSYKDGMPDTSIVDAEKKIENNKAADIKTDSTQNGIEGVNETAEVEKQIETAADNKNKKNNNDSIKETEISADDSIKSTSRFKMTKDINALISDSGMLKMELKDVLDFTITYNPRILNARADWLGKCRQQPATWAVFEPDFVTEYGGGFSEQIGSRYLEQKANVKIGVEGKFISGAQYHIGFSDNEIYHSAYTMEIPKAFSGITVTQPLLRDAWFGAPLTEIKIAKIDMNIAFHSYRSELMSTLYSVENAYWKLAFSQEKVRYAEESEEIAEKLLNDSKARNKAGKMSKMGLIEADAELAFRTALRTDAQRELEEAAHQLKITMSNNAIPSWMKMETSSPLYLRDNERIESNNDSVTKETIQYQPDFCISQYQSSREKVVVNYQSNQCLPTVNLTGSYGYYAYGRDGHSAIRNFERQGLLSWTAGVEARIPLIFGMKERSDLIAAKLKSRAASDNIISKEYELLNSLILIKNRIEALKNRIDNAKTVVDAREKQLAVEMGAIDAGKSNFRRAFEIEEDLDEAKKWQLESHMFYRQSILQWQLIKGTLLQKKGYEKVVEERPILIEHLSGPYKYLLWFLQSEEETNQD